MSAHRFSFGINSLDRVLGGGIPPGAVLSIVGNPGSGKSLLGFRYILTGLENGEEGLYISFTSIPLSTLIEEAMKYPLLDPLLSYVNPLFVEVSGPEVLYEVIDMIERSEVRRVVLDHPRCWGITATLNGSRRWKSSSDICVRLRWERLS